MSRLSLFQRAQKTLTCTHACLVPRLVPRVVTVQAFVWVTELGFRTHVSGLLGTHFAAPTAISHQAHPRRTSGLLRGASAGPVADFLTLIHFQRCSRPSSRGRVRWHTALCPAAELHLVIKVTLEEDLRLLMGLEVPRGGLQSGI